jgi:hypothetical protein
MKYIKEFKIFESENSPSMMDYLKTIALDEKKELFDIFVDLRDEFGDDIQILIRPYEWSPTKGLSYELMIGWSGIKVKTNRFRTSEEISDDLVVSSDNLAKFWTILNDCLKRLRNGNFYFKSTSSTESSLSILLSFN